MQEINMTYCPENCMYLSPNEELQNLGDKRPHFCRKFHKRLYHLDKHPLIYRHEARPALIEFEKNTMLI